MHVPAEPEFGDVHRPLRDAERGYGGSFASGAFVRCEGAITATFTWNGPADPPKSVVLTETSVVSARSMGWANWDNDLGSGNGVNANGSPIPKYTIKNDPGASFTVTRNPYARAQMNPQLYEDAAAGVSYTVDVAPITLEVSGTVRIGVDDKLLIGQGVRATLKAPFRIGPATWSIPGDTFDAYIVNVNDPQIGTLLAFTPNTASSQHRYWRETGDYTISVRADMTDDAGRTVGTATATREISVTEPVTTMTLTNDTNGQAYENASGKSTAAEASLYRGSGVPRGVGMYFAGKVITPPEFAQIQGYGGWMFAQFGDLFRCRHSLDGYRYITTTGAIQKDGSASGSKWLDTTWGYAPVLRVLPPWPGDGTLRTTNDNPSHSFDRFGDDRYDFRDDFDVYQFYLPPGDDSQWVPVRFGSWYRSARNTRPFGQPHPFAIPNSSVAANVDNVETHKHPTWSNLIALRVGRPQEVRWPW